MARIPETEIERLKNEVSVERLVEASGIELKKSGKDWLGRCPFHEDNTASLVVTPVKNLWHCFGCGIGGGPLDWVMKRRGVSFRHAVELLREGVVPLAADGAVLNNPRLRALPTPVAFDADDQALLNQTIDTTTSGCWPSLRPASTCARAVWTIPSWSRTSSSAWPTAPWVCACRRRPARPAPTSARSCRRSVCTARAATNTSTAR